jgi:SET domain-containing protein
VIAHAKQAGSKGYGIRSLGELRRGDYVTEYIGEVISGKEVVRRLTNAQVRTLTSAR